MGNSAVKASKIDELKETISQSCVAIATDYRGFTVDEITRLRRGLQENGAEYTVVKNTLTRIAVQDTDYEGLQEFLKGPTALVLGSEDPVSPAKTLSEFIKKAKKGSIKGGMLEGKVLNESDVKDLASLPSKDELYAKMLGSINSPATGIAMCINAVARDMVICIDQIRKQKEEAGQ